MSKKIFSEVNDKDEIKLKKLFYALRTAVACQWIMEKDENPPIVFQKMLEELDITDPIKVRIDELIKLKETKNEGYFHHEEKEINSFIRGIIQKAETEAQNLPSSKGKIEDLNQFFKNTLHNI